MIRLLIIVTVLICFFSSAAHARTNLKLPRFVTVKAPEANVRSGPGLRYRIEWVMVRPDMPVEVIAENKQWRRIKDIQGDEGWIHRSMLSNRRTVVITGTAQIMRKSSHKDSAPVARVEVGVNGSLLSCTQTACRVAVNDYKGWISRESLWGIYPEESN